MALHINIEDLLSARTVESDRIEFKEGWNPDPIYRSICAFANDFDNTGGGYIFIGVEEDTVTKLAIRPVKGLTTKQIGNIQMEMIGYNNLIKPYYAPKLHVEEIDNKQIIVLWVVAGSERPYEVPESVKARQKNWKYFIRRYASTIEAKGADKEELISLSNNIPFDDRANTQARLTDISMILVKSHLFKIKSKLAEELGKRTDNEILAQMELISGPGEHEFSRNVGLMMFAEEPHHFFPNTQVDIVYFPNGEAEDFTEYPIITGPIPEQIKRTLDFIKTNFLKERVIKPKDKAESIRIWNYPLQAIEETLVNAFYHRDYQVREPIEIRVYANSIVFINYGGPDRSIQMQAFQNGVVRARRYRNRRLGDFLKELELTEGRSTGIATIHKVLKENGSPLPYFNSDEDRTFLEVEIFIHPAFVTVKHDIVIEGGDGLIYINNRVDQLMSIAPDSAKYKARDKAEDAVRDIDGDIDGDIARGIVNALDRDMVIKIVADARKFVNEKLNKILSFCQNPKQRKEILQEIALVNNVKNYDTYMSPLIQMGWVAMTIPDKPTSPKQQYRTTLKGRVIKELLN
jgi:ATP-dependent DNA helicase RecG